MGGVNINPEALKWARMDAGYDYSNLPAEIRQGFEEWESGQTSPTWDQLRNISSCFKRPSAFFFINRLPEHFSVDLIDCRKSHYKSPDLTLGLREVVYKRETFMELCEDMHYQVLDFSQFRSDFKTGCEMSNHIRDILDWDSELCNDFHSLKERISEKVAF